MPPEFRLIERSASLTDQIYTVLKEQLHNGQLRGGETMREAALAQEMGVSRTPVREALARLMSEGLIEIQEGNRTMVVTSLCESDIEEIYELRVLLEVEAVRQAATEVISEAALDRVRRVLESAEHAATNEDADQFIQANREFRSAWLMLVPNRRLVQAVELYDGHVRALQAISLRSQVRQKIVIAGMKTIFNAIEARNPEFAIQAMNQYLETAREAMRESAGLQEQIFTSG